MPATSPESLQGKPPSTYCNATQQPSPSRRGRRKQPYCVSTIGVWWGGVVSACLNLEAVVAVRMESNGNLSPVADHSNLALRPAEHASHPPESGTSAALIPSAPALRSAFLCRQDQDETPRWKRKRKRETTIRPPPRLTDGLMCLSEGSARFTLVVQAPPHPQRRPPPSRLQRQSVQSRFRGTGFERRCSILQTSFERRQIFFSPTTFL